VSNRDISEEEVYRFIYEKIDSVPHLEALLQLWNSRPRRWSEEELAARLFLTAPVLHDIMRDLMRVELATGGDEEPKWFAYPPSSPLTDRMVGALAETYKRDLLRVTEAIHAKSSSGAREFGRAFKFRKKK